MALPTADCFRPTLPQPQVQWVGWPRMADISPAAQEALGCLAAFDHTGPHDPEALRRHTRLTRAGFQASILELVAHGLAYLEGNGKLWLTHQGEAWTRRLFDGLESATTPG